MFKEFKEFAMRGNVIDLAVGVIIGASFGKIVSSLVEDIITPPIGRLLKNLDFSNMYLPLSDKVEPGLGLVEAKKLGPVTTKECPNCCSVIPLKASRCPHCTSTFS